MYIYNNMESLKMILCVTTCVISFSQIIHGGGIPPDPCLSNPCQNGATCTSNGPQYTCGCAAGFMGTHCETAISEDTTMRSVKTTSGTNSLSDGKIAGIAVGCVLSVIIFLWSLFAGV